MSPAGGSVGFSSTYHDNCSIEVEVLKYWSWIEDEAFSHTKKYLAELLKYLAGLFLFTTWWKWNSWVYTEANSIVWNGRYKTEQAFCKGDDIFPKQYASTTLTEGGH